MAVTNITTFAVASSLQRNINSAQTITSAAAINDEPAVYVTADVVCTGGFDVVRSGIVFDFPHATATVRQIGANASFTDTLFTWRSASSWNKVALRTLKRCVLVGNGNAGAFPFAPENTDWDDVTMSKIGQFVFDVTSTVLAFNGVKVVDSVAGFWNACQNPVEVVGLAFSGSLPASMFVNQGARVDLINSPSVLRARTRIATGVSGTAADDASTRFIRYITTQNVATNASAAIYVWDNTTATPVSYTADSSGLSPEIRIVTHKSTNRNATTGNVIYADYIGTSGIDVVIAKHGFAVLRENYTTETALRVGTPAAMNGGNAISIPKLLTADGYVTLTDAQCAALDVAVFGLNGNTVTLSADSTLDELYQWLHWKKRQWLSTATRTATDATLDFSEYSTATGELMQTALSIATATFTLHPGASLKSLKTTGIFTGTATASVEDVSGVRVTVTKNGGGNFNIAARHGTAGAYTDLGYQEGVSTVTYSVPKGQPVEVAAWAEGFVTYTRLIDTAAGGVVLAMEMTANPNINTALDVSSYLANIALSLDTSGATPFFVITFNAPMTVSGIELGKAIIHRLVGSEVALRAGFPPGSTSTIVINADEITNQLPAARFALGAALSVTDRVYLDFFINTAPALIIAPAYVINPPRADGNQVQILRAKPALDASQLAGAVQQIIERPGGMLDGKASQAGVAALSTANQTEHDATQAAIAALPAPTTPLAAAAVAAAVRTELASELGRLDVAVGTRLATSAYTAPTTAPTALDNAAAVRTELASELGRIDAAVSSRLAVGDYTAPANADIAGIKAKTDTLANAPSVADIRAAMEAQGSKLDVATNAAKAAKRQTL